MATDAEQTAGEQAPQTEGAQTETTQQIPDVLTQRLDDLSSQLNDLRDSGSFQGGISQGVAQQTQQQQGFQEGAQAPEGEWPYGQEQQGYDPYGGQQGYGQQDFDQMAPQQAEQAAMQQLQQFIGTQVQQGIQQAIAPFQQDQIQREARALEEKYPDLADGKVAGPLLQQAMGYAHELGHPELGSNPRFIENFYLASQARDRAAQETPADGEKGVHLEGGGAVPSGTEEDDPATAMLKAHGIVT